jgi:hypothetical protein
MLVAGAVCAAVVPGALAASGPQAHAAANCSVNYYAYGYSYMDSLRVSHTSCKVGRAVAKKHGHVRGWRCSKKILDRSSVQYDAKITCHSGRRTVVWQYTQNS